MISTIHKLKSKERPFVFGVGWSEGWTEEGEPIGLLPHTLSLRSHAPEALEDERCVAFVLISRTKEACYLSGVREYKGIPMEPSRFVREMGPFEGQKF